MPKRAVLYHREARGMPAPLDFAKPIPGQFPSYR